MSACSADCNHSEHKEGIFKEIVRPKYRPSRKTVKANRKMERQRRKSGRR